MTTQLAMNPITGQLDLIQNLSEYIKNAIPITIAEKNNLVTNSQLIPNQWYLLTDYQTIDYIRNSEKTDGNNNRYEFYTAPVEQIYIQAKTNNSFYLDGKSFTYPDEDIKYIDTRSDYQIYAGITYEDTVNSGEINLVVEDTDTISFTNAPKTIPDDVIIENTWFELVDDDTGAYIYCDSNNYNDVWTFNSSGEFVLLKPYQEVIDSHYLYYEEETSYGDVDIVIESSSVLSIDTSNDLYTKDFYLYIQDEEDYVELNQDNLGTVWSYEKISDATYITLINSTLDLTSEYTYIEGNFNYISGTLDFDFNNIVYVYAEICFLAQVLNALITNRQNSTYKTDIDFDYRGTKFRRFAPDISAYSSGTTYAVGEFVQSGSSIFIKVSTAVAGTAPTNTYAWTMVFQNYSLSGVQQFLTGVINVGWAGTTTYTLNPDYSDYVDGFFVQNATILNTSVLLGVQNTTIKKKFSETNFDVGYGVDFQIIRNSTPNVSNGYFEQWTSNASITVATVLNATVKAFNNPFISTNSLLNSVFNYADMTIVNDASVTNFFSKTTTCVFNRIRNFNANCLYVERFVSGNRSGSYDENNTVTGYLKNILAVQTFANNTIVITTDLLSPFIRLNYFNKAIKITASSSIDSNIVLNNVYDVEVGTAGAGGFNNNLIVGTLGTSGSNVGVRCGLNFSNNNIYSIFYSSGGNKFRNFTTNTCYGTVTGMNTPYTTFNNNVFLNGLTGASEGALASTNYNVFSYNYCKGDINTCNLGAKSITTKNYFMDDLFRLEFDNTATTNVKLLENNVFQGKASILQIKKGTFKLNNFLGTLNTVVYNPATESGVFEKNTLGNNFSATITNNTINTNNVVQNATLTLSNSVTGTTISRSGSRTPPALTGVYHPNINIRGEGTSSTTFTIDTVNSAGTQILRVRDDGMIGIGTASPSEVLDVVGTIKATGYKSGTTTGQTTTATIVTDIRDNAGQMQKKTQLLTFTSGLLTTKNAESDWTDTTDI